jgi:hypothetical protein
MRRIVDRLLQRLAAEHGIALVMALGISVALGATAASAIAYSSASAQQTGRSKSEQIAVSLAEAGLNQGLAQLYGSSSPGMASALPSAGAPQQQTVAGIGRLEWYGVLQGSVWTVTGVGYAPHPSPQLPEITRRVSMRVQIGSAVRGTADTSVWNYVYADDPTGCTTLGNSSSVNVPLYIRGNLCLENSSRVTGYSLRVGGTLTITGSQAGVGSSTTPIPEAQIGGGCSTDGRTFHTPCSAADRVWATTITASPAGLTKPPVDFDYWYRAAAPGPQRGCSAGSLPGGFDSDSLLNRSRAAFDLTPNTAYDCRVYDTNGVLVGQLTWQPGAPGTLTIAGTILFDGDITMGQSAMAVYVGKATLYTTGRFNMGQQSTLCGIAGCTTSWRPANNLLAVVAGYSPGDSVTIQNYSTFQGAFYAVADYREGNNSTVWGPIVANKIFLQNSTLNHYVPIGTPLPGMPAPMAGGAVRLSNVSGSWKSS